MPAARRSAPEDADAARGVLLTGLADGAALADLVGGGRPLAAGDLDMPAAAVPAGADAAELNGRASAALTAVTALVPDLAAAGTLPPDAIPSTIVIDRQGRIAARIVGPTTELRLRALLAPLAAQV